MADEDVIKPFTVERVCQPKLDVAQLSFKTVDTSESVYTRALVHLQNASLPAGIAVSMPRRVPGSAANAGVIYMKPKPGLTGEAPDTPVLELPPSPPTPVEPTPPAPDAEGAEPVLVPYDLYVVLKYRQDWTPTGYGIGELLFTTSLMPDEELTLEMKTWETSRVQQDTEDSTDQRNVSDIKSTASSASEAVSEQQTKTNEHMDAKASYSGFGFSASVEGGWSQDISDLQKNMEKRTQERAEQTTSEHRSTHKVKVAISRESGSESKTTRRIKNINQTHTLNVNYYEVLREFSVELTPYEAVTVLLGAEPSLAEPTGYHSWDGAARPITLGHLIRAAQSGHWVQQFIDVYGLSPIKLLRERWSAPLYDAAMVRLDWWAEEGVQIQPEDREDFQRTMLRYIRPTPGWLEPDEKGALRWGYEVVEGKEKDLLSFLYGFLPYSPQQVMARAAKANMRSVAAMRAMTSRYAQAVVPAYNRLATMQPTAAMARRALEAPHLELAGSKQLLVRGPFYQSSIVDPRAWEEFAEQWVEEHVVDQLAELRPTLGRPTASWKTTLPTQGVYADLALGLCSGAEDYFEITRQFDLEHKRLEIRRMELEVEKLRIENTALQQGKPQFVVEGAADHMSVNLDLSVPEMPSSVELRKPEA